MTLAINGGTPVRTTLFPNQANIGFEETTAVQRILQSQMLSGYRGNAQKYRGGVEIQKLESMWSEKFNVKHSIAINSCTSALQVACMAIGLKPGDEVIVSPYSMTCSATAPMICGATPVFADVEKDFFCLDPESVESRITERTKAIIAVSLFGQPFSNDIIDISIKHDLFLIADHAQSPGSKMYETFASCNGDIDCFSFTQGKHMTAGEGGMIATQDGQLAEKCRLLMNHAEAVINDSPVEYSHWDDMFGSNLRMTEIQAAIAQEQLKKLDFSIGKRKENAHYISSLLMDIPCITPAPERSNCSHVYYVQAFLYDKEKVEGIHRDKFIEAVKAELQPMQGRESEGVRISCGYIKPIYRMPIFSKTFFEEDMKSTHFPNVEKLWKDELFLHLYLAPPTSRMDLDDISKAFHKVWEHKEELK